MKENAPRAVRTRGTRTILSHNTDKRKLNLLQFGLNYIESFRLTLEVHQATKISARKPPIYDRFAPYFDRALAPLERWFLAGLRARACALLPTGANHILEIGAGTGLNFSYYSPATDLVASELSWAMLHLARCKLRRPSHLHLVQNRAEEVPFRDATFDACLATLVFCSVANPMRAFTELRRVTKPGGSIVLLEHVRPNGLLGHAFDLLNVFTVALFEDHFNRRTCEEARRAGLEIIHVEHRCFGIFNLILCCV